MHDTDAFLLHSAAHPAEYRHGDVVLPAVVGEALGHVVHAVEAADEHHDHGGDVRMILQGQLHGPVHDLRSGHAAQLTEAGNGETGVMQQVQGQHAGACAIGDHGHIALQGDIGDGGGLLFGGGVAVQAAAVLLQLPAKVCGGGSVVIQDELGVHGDEAAIHQA